MGGAAELGALGRKEFGQVWYWNQQNFEGLSEVADSIADQLQWSLFADYCRLRESGLRNPALQAITQFIAEAAAWPTADRRHFADWIYTTQLRLPEVHQLIATPLKQDFLIPILQQWTETESRNPVPYRWLGCATGDHAYFAIALSLEPGDDISRYRLVSADLADVEYQCHHLPDYFIGDPEDALGELEHAKDLAQEFSDPRIAQIFTDGFTELFGKINDWIAYQATSQDTSFIDWCKNHDRKYTWSRSYYYTR